MLISKADLFAYKKLSSSIHIKKKIIHRGWGLPVFIYFLPITFNMNGHSEIHFESPMLLCFLKYLIRAQDLIS